MGLGLPGAVVAAAVWRRPPTPWPQAYPHSMLSLSSHDESAEGQTCAAITGCAAAPQPRRQTQEILRAPTVTHPEECTTAAPVATSPATPVLLGRHRDRAALATPLPHRQTGQRH